MPDTMKFVYTSYFLAVRSRDRSISFNDSLSKMPDYSQSSGLAPQTLQSTFSVGTTSPMRSSASSVFSIRSKKGSQMSLVTSAVSVSQSTLVRNCR